MNSGESLSWRCIAFILVCAVISLFVVFTYSQGTGMRLESFQSIIPKSEVGKSREANMLKDEDLEIEVLKEVRYEKKKKIWSIEKVTTPPTSSPQKPTIFTHEELCDEKLTYDKLPDDDSWSKRWMWPRPQTLRRTPPEKEIMLIIYRHQLCRGDLSLPDPCERTMEFDSYRTGTGIGSRMITLSKALANSMYSDRVLRISLGDWIYSSKEKCPEMSDICFHQEVSRCPNVSWPYAKDFKIFGIAHPEPGDTTPHVRMWFPAGDKHPPIPKLSTGSSYQTLNFWYSSQLLYFLIQPKEWILKRVNEARLKLGIKTPYLALHVRHGDKAFEGSEFFDLAVYMNVSKKHFPLVKNILVMTSDQAVIEDTKYYPEYTFYWTDYPRHNADIRVLMNEGVLDRSAEMVNTLINFYLAVESAGMVCTLTSNFPRAIMRFQYGAYNYVNPVYSLDEWRKDIALHSFPKLELGDAVHLIKPANYI